MENILSEAREGTPEPPPRRTASEAAMVPAPEPPKEPTIDDVIVAVHQKEGCGSAKYLNPKFWL